MPRFDFQSPGAAATAGIQDFIRQRNADERTALLDALNKQNVEHGWQMDEENLKLSKSADSRAATKQEDDLYNAYIGRLVEGTPASQMDPKYRDRARSEGLIRTETPKVSTSSSLTPPEGLDPTQLEAWAKSIESGSQNPQWEFVDAGPSNDVYVGDKDYRGEQRARGYVDEAIGDPRINTDPDTLRALLLSKATGAQLPGSIVGPAPSITPLGPSGKVFPRINLPRGGGVDQLPWQPASYFGGAAGTAPKLYQIFKGGQWQASQIFTPQEADSFLSTNPDVELRAGNTPTPSRPNAADSRELVRARAALEAVRANGGGTQWSWSGTVKTPQHIAAETAYKQALARVFNATGAPPDIQETAIDIMVQGEDAGKSINQLIQEGNLKPDQWNPNEIQKLQELLNYANGINLQ